MVLTGRENAVAGMAREQVMHCVVAKLDELAQTHRANAEGYADKDDFHSNRMRDAHKAMAVGLSDGAVLARSLMRGMETWTLDHEVEKIAALPAADDGKSWKQVEPIFTYIGEDEHGNVVVKIEGEVVVLDEIDRR